MKNTWKKPAASTLSEYQKSVISLVPQGNIPKIMEANEKKLIKLAKNLPKKKLNYRYAKGKWSIPEIIVHLIDTERVLTYRILAVSRGDSSPLPGFDQDMFIKNIDVSALDFKRLLKEYKVVRKSTLHLLKQLTEESYMRKGVANNNATSVQKMVYFMAGHEVHHMKIIKEKYLKK
jgi:uncharacterized damage-inducible protein DinB